MATATRERFATGIDGEDFAGEEGPPSQAELRRERQGRNRDLDRAYQAGRTGRPFPLTLDQDDAEIVQAHQAGLDEHRQARQAGLDGHRQTPTPRSDRPSARSGGQAGRPGPGPVSFQIREHGAGIILGALGYAAAYNLAKGGPAGLKAWFAAKFYNQTSTSGASGGNPEIQGGVTPGYPYGGSGGPNSANGANGNTGPGGLSPSGNGQPVYQAGYPTLQGQPLRPVKGQP